MNTRNSYDYAKPTTLVLIISDALETMETAGSSVAVWKPEVSEIVTDAFNALEALVGAEEAFEMLLQAGIGPAELDAVWPPS